MRKAAGLSGSGRPGLATAAYRPAGSIAPRWAGGVLRRAVAAPEGVIVMVKPAFQVTGVQKLWGPMAEGVDGAAKGSLSGSHGCKG